MTDEQIEQEVEAGIRCVRCHELFDGWDEKVTAGNHPITGVPLTRAVHAPSGVCQHYPFPATP